VCGVEGRQKLLNNLAVELLLQHPREFLGTVLKEKINYRRLNFLLIYSTWSIRRNNGCELVSKEILLTFSYISGCEIKVYLKGSV
jgi:hypothetical protein